MKPKIAAAYIRVSTEDQTEFSPDAQRRELEAYARSHDLLLEEAHIYVDEGISGRQARRRPGFMAMIRAAREPEHPFDVILVHKYDRFARSREDSVVYKSMLRRCGVEVVSIKEPIAEGNYAGVMEAIYESFAEAYSVNLGQEVKKGMTEKALRGQLQAPPPFGYRLTPAGPGADRHPRNRLEPHPQEAEAVRGIFQRYAAGEGACTIARQLNLAGWRTHRGNPFESRAVTYILANPIYVGTVRWNPEGKTGRFFENPSLILARGDHPPLVDPALWQAVQARLAEARANARPYAKPAGDRSHWLCGLLRCAACGAPLVWVKPHYFRCGGYARGKCPQSQHVCARVPEDCVVRCLKAHFAAAGMPSFRLLEQDDPFPGQEAELQRALVSVARRKDRLLDALVRGAEIPVDAYNRMTARLEQEAAELRRRLSALPRPTEPEADRAARILETLRTLELPEFSTARKHEAAAQVIDRCLLDRQAGTLHIVFRDAV